MLPSRIEKWHLWLCWVIVTTPSVLISFDLTLPIYIAKAHEVNAIVQGWSFVFSSSLLFWMVTETLSERKRLLDAARVQRDFIDGIQNKFNELVQGFIGEGEVQSDHFTETADIDLYQIIWNWADSQEKDGIEWGCTSIRWFLEDVVVRETDIAYYRGVFSRQFNSHLNNTIRTFKSGVRFGLRSPQRKLEITMAHLTMFRKAMIELDNLYRNEHDLKALPLPSWWPSSDEPVTRGPNP